MANIDISTIEGFENMTVEEKLAAVLALDIPEPEQIDMSKFVSKEVFDKKASEAASLSKQLKSKMTEDELAQAERERIQSENDEKYSALEGKYNELIKESTIAGYKAKYLAQGYDEKLAQSTAQALADGDMETVFKNGEAFKSDLEKKIKADQMKNDPQPGGSASGDEEGSDNDSAVKKAKELAQARNGVNQSYEDVIGNYK